MPIPAKDKSRFLKYIEKWKKRLLLDSWSVITTFSNEDKVTQESVYTHGTMNVNLKYKEGRMTIFPVILEDPLESQKATIIHELLHLHLEPLSVILWKAEKKGVLSEKRRWEIIEELTELMTKIIWKAYNKDRKPGEFQV